MDNNTPYQPHGPQATPPQSPYQRHAYGADDAQNETHLKLLRIFYYIMAGFSLLGVCGGVVYGGMGVVLMSANVQTGPNDPPPEVMGGILLGVGAVILLLSIVMAAMAFYSAKGFATGTYKTLIYITAGLFCLSVPLGTALGIYTFIVMGKPGVQARFR